MDVENFLSNRAPNNAYVPRSSRRTSPPCAATSRQRSSESLLTDAVKPKADYGRIAYVDDPLRTSSDPRCRTATPAPARRRRGEEQTPYDVSRLDYYPS
jgi:hypothetical protein